MPNSFKIDNIPFSLLNEEEQTLLRANLDIAYFQKGETVIQAGEVPDGLHVVLKGRVSESEAVSEDGEKRTQHVFVHYENEDYFGGWSALRGKAIHNFVAEEETICHILPTRTLLDLMATNAQFADYFQQNLAVKREIVAQHGSNQDMAEFMLAKITDATVREPLVVEQGTSIHAATELMRSHKADCVLARKGGRYGMVTGTDLLDAVVLKQLPLETDVSDIASYRLIAIDHEDYLFNALVMMTQQQIERVVVMDGQEMVGIVELTDVLSYFSSHSHVIGLRIERAASIDQLREAAQGLNELIKALISTGVKIRFTMDLLAAMNGRIIAKLFDLIVPADMQPHVCLIVMGSEGRAEQIMKPIRITRLYFVTIWPGLKCSNACSNSARP